MELFAKEKTAAHNSASKKLLLSSELKLMCEVKLMGLKLKVDGKDIPLNDFVEKMLSGTVVGAVTSLKGIKAEWKKIELDISN